MIVGRGPTVYSAPADRGGGAKRTIRISLEQLMDLKRLKVRLGPFNCKQWHSCLETYFAQCRREPFFSQYFSQVEDIFLHDLDMDRFYKESRSGLALHFFAHFPSFAAKSPRGRFAQRLLKVTPDQILGASEVFLQLKDFSLKIARARAEKRPYQAYIEEANEKLGVMSASPRYALDFQVRIEG